jgi:hypothetical protein
MGKMDYVNAFNIKSEETDLHILICVPMQSNDVLLNAEFLDPKLLAKLPLSYADQQFDLVLVGNILFGESQSQSEDSQEEILLELIRVGTEVRVFPLVHQDGQPSDHLGRVTQILQKQGLSIELRQVLSENKGTLNAMLRIWNTTCQVKKKESV